MSGFLDKEEWLISFEDEEREFYERKKKLEAAISELEFKRAKNIQSNPAEAKSCEGGIEEGKKLLKKLNVEAGEAAKPFEAIRPKFSDSTVSSFCAFLAFALAFPDMMCEEMSLRTISSLVVLWVAHFLPLEITFHIVDIVLKKIRKPTKFRKIKTILAVVAICSVYAMGYSYIK